MILRDLNTAVDLLLTSVSGPVRLATPLGLGKPNVYLNALYERCKHDSARPLEIYTALSLDPPNPQGLLAERFEKPFVDRHFGADYPRLAYVRDLHNGAMPAHIRLHEFYMQAGQFERNARAQQGYVSLNYTHVARSLLDRGLNCIAQLVARGPGGRLSLASNPDLTLDLVDFARDRGRKLFLLAVVHDAMPFMVGDAEVPESFFDAVLEGPEHQHELFALPRAAIDPASHMIGLHASQLVHDGGTLQLGIGSLSEALTHFLTFRQSRNADYTRLLGLATRGPSPLLSSTAPFTEGLYGTSEMVLDGFMHLRRGGILKRTVRDAGTGGDHFIHGGFILGSKPFYEWLRELPPAERAGLAMTRISKVNDLYDADELSLRRQRRKARFFNGCMNVNLLGGAVSDTLEDGTVVSGVGGQYNFVAMSHELPDALSSLMLKSTRTVSGRRLSNVVFEGGHLTIPRHLRDAVVTEYGVAILRGRSDSECVEAMLAVTDSEFQEELVEKAKRSGKLDRGYRLPDYARGNHPSLVAEMARAAGDVFLPYPFGSDFTREEERLVGALERLRHAGPLGLAGYALRGLFGADFGPEVERMRLGSARSPAEWVNRALLRGALRRR